jgi:hypothetical protein
MSSPLRTRVIFLLSHNQLSENAAKGDRLGLEIEAIPHFRRASEAAAMGPPFIFAAQA